MNQPMLKVEPIRLGAKGQADSTRSEVNQFARVVGQAYLVKAEDQVNSAWFKSRIVLAKRLS